MKIPLSFASPYSTSIVASFLVFGVTIRTTTSFSSSNRIRIRSRTHDSFTNPYTVGTSSSCTPMYAYPPSSSSSSSSSSSAATVVTTTTAVSPSLTQKRKRKVNDSVNTVGSVFPLRMSSITDESITSQSSISIIRQRLPDGITEVLSAAFLITANTIGPSIMVVPGAMAGPGFIVSSTIMAVVWGINLLSALLIAEVAINQYEASSCDIPSSFKDFAEINLQSKAGGVFVSILCIFVNWCVVSFNLIQMGDIVVTNLPTFSGSILEMPPIPHSTAINTAATLSAVGFTALVGTQTNQRLSGVASLCCLGLFTTFASILIPGLANVQSNPLSFIPETADISSFGFGALPIFVAVMIFQNIVPTVVSVLGYDRKKCVLAMVIGSVVPLLMHLSFSYAVLGGGIDLDLGTGGPLLNIFSTVSVLGSTMACLMSLAGEFDSHLNSKDDYNASDSQGVVKVASSSTLTSTSTSIADSEQEGDFDEIASIPALTLAVVPPLLVGIYFSGGEEFVQAISISGSYASPLLYGVIPMILAWIQRNSSKSKSKSWGVDKSSKEDDRTNATLAPNVSSIFQSIVPKTSGGRNNDQQTVDGFQELAPGGSFGLGLLGASSVLLISQNLMTDLAGVI